MTDLVVQPLDILLDGIDELSLVLLNSTPNLRANEQRVEFAEHAEHLVRVTSGTQAVTQSCNNLVLYASDAFIVRVLCSNPDFATLCNAAFEFK